MRARTYGGVRGGRSTRPPTRYRAADVGIANNEKTFFHHGGSQVRLRSRPSKPEITVKVTNHTFSWIYCLYSHKGYCPMIRFPVQAPVDYRNLCRGSRCRR